MEPFVPLVFNTCKVYLSLRRRLFRGKGTVIRSIQPPDPLILMRIPLSLPISVRDSACSSLQYALRDSQRIPQSILKAPANRPPSTTPCFAPCQLG